MDILFMADIVPYPPNTGIKIRTYNIIKQLSRNKKNNIYLLAFNHKVMISTEGEMRKAIGALEGLCKEVHILDIPSDRNRFTYTACLAKNLFQSAPYRVKRYYSGQCVKKIKYILKGNNIDLVHLDKTEFFVYKPLFGDIPVVCTNHNVESELMKQRIYFEVNLLRKCFAFLQFVKTKKFEKKALNSADAYITCTDEDRDFFKEHFGVNKPHATIDNGVDISKYLKKDLDEEHYVLIIGAQNRESTANYDATRFFLTEIWPLITRRDPALLLKIVGRNPDKSILRLNNEVENIKVYGFVENESEIIEKAKALVVPLRIGGGSRLKILTAMAMSKVIVSTSKGAEGIKCTDGKDILIADNPALFADQVLKAAHEPVLRKKIGENARVLSEERYDWDKIGDRLLNFYRWIVKKNG